MSDDHPNDDYLWDRSGEADPDVARLEGTLAPLRYQPRALATSEKAPRTTRVAWRRPALRFAIAASLVASFAGLFGLLRRGGPSHEITVLSWDVPTRVGDGTVLPHGRAKPVSVGEWIETPAEVGRARVQLARGLGRVVLEPGTRLRVTVNRGDQQRLDLAHGSIHARVDAPPRLFLVDTPAATATDLGCAYRLTAAPDGHGSLAVETGWVALDREGRSVMVPAGSVCEIRPERGPGTPHQADAPAEWLAELARFDFENGGEHALRAVLAGARSRDAISLWNLLARVDGPLRGEVYDRLAAIAPPPSGVTRAAALSLQTGSLDVWRLAIVPNAFATKSKGAAKQPLVDEPPPADR